MKLSILLASRKNSKFLAKFLMCYMEYTFDISAHELLCMYNTEDTWNQELISQMSSLPGVSFYKEDLHLGRSGLHEYFNTLATHATGDFLIYFCEDHCIVQPNWDQTILAFIRGNKIDPAKVNMIVPKFDNIGAMNQIVSRKWFETLGNIGRFGNIDSYNNYVAEKIDQTRIHPMDFPLFHDFTHDPQIMTPEHCRVQNETPLPEQWGDPSVMAKIIEDAAALQKAIESEV
jgi:hypothetical protein